MDNTIIQQGSFTSDASSKLIQLRSGVDWMRVYNYTAIGAGAQGTGVSAEFYWQAGMADGSAFQWKYTDAATTLNLNLLTSSGFYYQDNSINTLGNNVAITRIPANGVVLTGTTTGLAVGSIVRFNSVVNGAQLNGLDFSVTAINPGVSFTIVPPANMVDTGATTGNYRIVPFNPLFYPNRRTITNITSANPGVVTTSVPHGYTVGQQVRLNLPTVSSLAYGMNLLNGVLVTVSAVGSTTTFSINLDTTSLGTFAFPLTANSPFTPGVIIPVGEIASTVDALGNTYNPNLLDDATLNTGYIGMLLTGGANGPGGANNNVMYWTAGKSFSV